MVTGLIELLQEFACYLLTLMYFSRAEMLQGHSSMLHSRGEVLLPVRRASCLQRFFACYTCRRPFLLFREPRLPFM